MINPSLLDFLITFTSVTLTYIFGRMHASKSQKLVAAKERYEKFYVPYIAALYRGYVLASNFSAMSLESRSLFFDLAMNNIDCLGARSQQHIPLLYSSFLDLLEYGDNPSSVPGAPEQADKIFNLFTAAVLSEAKGLSATLRKPDITQGLSSMKEHTRNLLS